MKFNSHYTITAAVDPLSYCLVDPQLHCDNVMTKFMINNGTDALKTDVNLFSCIPSYTQHPPSSFLTKTWSTALPVG